MFLFDNIIKKLDENNIRDGLLLSNQSMLDWLEENDPKDNDTIGCLVSKLSCVTIQMWFNQEILYSIRFMSNDDFIDKYSNNIAEIHKTIKRACDLNVQRARIVDAIDKKIIEIKNLW